MLSRLTHRQRLGILVLLVLVAFALGACKRKQQLVSTATTNSEVQKEQGVTPRDSNVTVPGSRVEGSVPLPLPGQDIPTETVRSDRAWSSVAVRNGRIVHSGGCDSASFVAKLYDRWSREHSSKASTEVVHQVTEKEVPYTPKWVWWSLLLGIAGAVKLLWPIVAKILKFLKPLF